MIHYEMGRWKRLFFAIWCGQACSSFGSRLVSFAVIWWLTAKTGSAATLAAAGLADTLPRMALSLLAGPLIDRWSRRFVMIAADSFVAVATACLALLFAFGADQPVYVIALILVRSSGDALHSSAMSAATSLLAPKDQLARVAGLNQVLEGASNMAAPALGALLITVLPMQLVLAIDVATAAVAVATLAFIVIPEPDKTGAQVKAASFARAFAEGFTHLAAAKGLLFLFIYGAILYAAAPAWRFLPLLVTSHLNGGAVELGMTSSAFGVGTVVGGALLGFSGGFKRRIVTSWTSRLGSGVAFLVLGLAPANGFAAAVAACGSFGITAALSLGAQRALIQATVPAALQGRIFSIFRFALDAMQPVGFVTFGVLGERFGPTTLFAIAGVALLLIGAAMAMTPALARMESTPAPPATRRSSSACRGG